MFANIAKKFELLSRHGLDFKTLDTLRTVTNCFSLLIVSVYA